MHDVMGRLSPYIYLVTGWGEPVAETSYNIYQVCVRQWTIGNGMTQLSLQTMENPLEIGNTGGRRYLQF